MSKCSFLAAAVAGCGLLALLVGCGPSTVAGNSDKMPPHAGPPKNGGAHPPGFTPPVSSATGPGQAQTK